VALGEPWDRPAVPFHLLLALDRDGADAAGVCARSCPISTNWCSAE
jgi:hypothetical protein